MQMRLAGVASVVNLRQRVANAKSLACGNSATGTAIER
jgi:hypothetical protein